MKRAEPKNLADQVSVQEGRDPNQDDRLNELRKNIKEWLGRNEDRNGKERADSKEWKDLGKDVSSFYNIVDEYKKSGISVSHSLNAFDKTYKKTRNIEKLQKYKRAYNAFMYLSEKMPEHAKELEETDFCFFEPLSKIYELSSIAFHKIWSIRNQKKRFTVKLCNALLEGLTERKDKTRGRKSVHQSDRIQEQVRNLALKIKEPTLVAHCINSDSPEQIKSEAYSDIHLYTGEPPQPPEEAYQLDYVLVTQEVKNDTKKYHKNVLGLQIITNSEEFELFELHQDEYRKCFNYLYIAVPETLPIRKGETTEVSKSDDFDTIEEDILELSEYDAKFQELGIGIIQWQERDGNLEILDSPRVPTRNDNPDNVFRTYASVFHQAFQEDRQ
jgi:hypothetical protein